MERLKSLTKRQRFILGALSLLVLVSLALFLNQKKRREKEEKATFTPTPFYPSFQGKTVLPTDWMEYKNKAYSYSLMYPPELVLYEKGQSQGWLADKVSFGLPGPNGEFTPILELEVYKKALKNLLPDLQTIKVEEVEILGSKAKKIFWIGDQGEQNVSVFIPWDGLVFFLMGHLSLAQEKLGTQTVVTRMIESFNLNQK